VTWNILEHSVGLRGQRGLGHVTVGGKFDIVVQSRRTVSDGQSRRAVDVDWLETAGVVVVKFG